MSSLRLFFVAILLLASTEVLCQADAHRLRIAVLEFGEEPIGKRVGNEIFRSLRKERDFAVIDRDESRAAAMGSGYRGSLNMTIEEARNLGSAIGCDFFITGDARTLRRLPFSGVPYFESYASVFIVSARSGRLILWMRPKLETPAPEESEKKLLGEITSGDLPSRFATSIRNAFEGERTEREKAFDQNAPIIEELPEDDAATAKNLRTPLPYRRLRPAYPESAATLEIEAVVDVEVEIDLKGEVTGARVVRWAGFGLDESAMATVRQLHFRPALRDGSPIPMRVMLRYNFRRPGREEKR